MAWNYAASIKPGHEALAFAAVGSIWVIRGIHAVVGIDSAEKTVKWQYDLHEESIFGYKSIAHVQEHALFTTTVKNTTSGQFDVTLICLDVNDGSECWRYAIGWSQTQNFGGLQAYQELIIFTELVSGTHHFTAIEAESGEQVFVREGIEVKRTENIMHGVITTLINADYYYACHQEAGVYRTKLDADSTFQLIDQSPVVSLANCEGVAALSTWHSAEQTITLFDHVDASSSKSMVLADKEYRRLLCSNVEKKQVVALLESNQGIALIDLAEQTLIWEIEQTDWTLTDAIVVNGEVIVAYREDAARKLMAVDIASGSFQQIEVMKPMSGNLYGVGDKFFVSARRRMHQYSVEVQAPGKSMPYRADPAKIEELIKDIITDRVKGDT